MLYSFVFICCLCVRFVLFVCFVFVLFCLFVVRFLVFGLLFVCCMVCFFFLWVCCSYHGATSRSQHRTTQKENILPGLGVVVAGGVVVIWGGVVNAGVVVAAEIQLSNDGDGKRCCRIGNRHKRTK